MPGPPATTKGPDTLLPASPGAGCLASHCSEPRRWPPLPPLATQQAGIAHGTEPKWPLLKTEQWDHGSAGHTEDRKGWLLQSSKQGPPSARADGPSRNRKRRLRTAPGTKRPRVPEHTTVYFPGTFPACRDFKATASVPSDKAAAPRDHVPVLTASHRAPSSPCWVVKHA